MISIFRLLPFNFFHNPPTNPIIFPQRIAVPNHQNFNHKTTRIFSIFWGDEGCPSSPKIKNTPKVLQNV